MQLRRYDFEVDADGYQFHLLAEGLDQEAFPLNQSEADIARMLAVVDGIVTVGTARVGGVAVAVEICDEAPAVDFDAWDHITECAINLASAGLLVAGGTDALLEDVTRIDVAAGSYRVRVSYGGSTEVPADLVSPGDHYRVQLWPGTRIEPVILKQMDAAIAARMP